MKQLLTNLITTVSISVQRTKRFVNIFGTFHHLKLLKLAFRILEIKNVMNWMLVLKKRVSTYK